MLTQLPRSGDRNRKRLADTEVADYILSPVLLDVG